LIPNIPENLPTSAWCGTAVWLPGYPFAIHVLSLIGVPSDWAALAIAWSCILGVLAVAWFGWTRTLSPSRSIAVLILLALFPGAIYSFALFPMSMALFGIVAAMLGVIRRRFVLASLAMFVAVLSYPSAAFAVVGLVVAMLIHCRNTGRMEFIKHALCGIGGLAGLGVLALNDQLAYGHWNAYLLIQGENDKNFGGLPGSQIFHAIVDRNTVQQMMVGHRGGQIIAAQVLLEIVLVGAAVIVGVAAWRRHGRSPLDLYPAVIGISVFLGLAITGPHPSNWTRGIVLAAPSVLALRRVPKNVLIAILMATALVALLLSKYFFNTKLA
jgi:hypothetical protein